MKKNVTRKRAMGFPPMSKFLLTVKLIFILVCNHGLLSGMADSSYAQSTKLTLSLKDASIKSVLEDIENKSEYSFMYDNSLVDVNSKVNIEANSEPISTILNRILGDDIESRVVGMHIILFPSDKRLAEIKQSFHQFQQQRDVSGKVTDNNNQALPGVTVMIKGTPRGTVTNADGIYTLTSIPEDAILQFSFVGMQTQEVVVGGRTNIDVRMLEDFLEIEEVVAVGYGTQKKINVTGAVSMIDGDDLVNRPTTGTLDALQGVMPGTVITRTSGSPGQEGYNIEIRGLISVGNNPALVLIDGFEADLNSIRPEDIESISVLKDAAAASIYGSKAAGGVILVTTKKGKEGKLKVEYNSYYSLSKQGRHFNRLSSYEIAKMRNLAHINAGIAPVVSDEMLGKIADPNYLIEIDPRNPNLWRYFGDYDYRELLLKTYAPQQSHNVSVSGGSENTTYRLSTIYYQNQGINKYGPDSNDKYTGSFNIDTRLGEFVKLSNNVSYARDYIEKPSFNDLDRNYGILGLVSTNSGLSPIFDPNGNWAQGFWIGNWDNRNQFIMYSHEGGIRKNEYNNLRWNSELTINNIIKGLEFRILGGINADFNNIFEHKKAIKTYGVDGVTVNNLIPNFNKSYIIKQSENRTLKEFQFLTNYNLQVNEHSFNVLLGYSAQDFRFENVLGQRSNLINSDLPSFDWASPDNITLTDDIQTNAMQSLFGRLNYVFKERYLFEANARYDGSSKLSPKNRYQLFPSASIGWRVNKEPWFDINFISELKPRVSHGQLGNTSVLNNYSFYPMLTVANNLVLNTSNQNTNYVYQDVLASELISWEIIETSNVGIDLGLFKNKLFITADYFRMRNKNMIASIAYPSVIGLGVPNLNVGEMKNWGWEANATWKHKKGDLNYWINANISDTKNELVDYYGANVVREGLNRLLLNYPINSIFGYKTDGFFQTPEEVKEHAFQSGNTGAGDVKYIDLNNDDVISPGNQRVDDHGDLVYLGNTNPRHNFGVRAGFNWNLIDFSLFFQGVGKRVFLMNNFSLMPFFQAYLNPHEHHLDYWSEDNPDAFWPRPYVRALHNFKPSNKWIQDAAYIRLKDIQIGYTMPDKLTSMVNISKLRLYFAGRDIWEITKTFDYIDPEFPNNASHQYPFRRSYSVGINVSF